MNELEQALSAVPPEQADEYRLLVETFAPEPLDDELECYVDETDTGLVCRWAIMDKAERQTLKVLPDLVPVYRGARGPDAARDGLSWTTLPYTAHWFAHRWARDGDEPTVAEGHVERSKIVACFDQRGEREVVALPEDVAVSRLVSAQRVER